MTEGKSRAVIEVKDLSTVLNRDGEESDFKQSGFALRLVNRDNPIG